VTRPELDELLVADPPEAWEALGFTVADGVVALGGVRIRLGERGSVGERGSGIVGWSLRGLAPGADLDGLEARASTAASGDAGTVAAAAAAVAHPLGAIAVDHVVALTPDLDRTVGKLRSAGLDHRRTREAGEGFRQAFFVVGPCLLELGGPADGDVRLWGLTIVVEDLDAAALRLRDRLGRVKDAVQPGRRIATVRREAGLSVPLALMTPRPRAAA
jgi:hypothetical protein